MPLQNPQQLLNDLEDLLKKSPELERRIPVRPEQPISADCCGQSCAPCVYDMYQSELDDWARRCWYQLRPSEENKENQQDKPGPESTAQAPTVFSLQPNVYQTLRLVSITPMTSDTNTYRFALPAASQRLFLPVGTHVIMRGFHEAKLSANGEKDEQKSESVVEQLLSVVRQYTPITLADTVGYMDLMIKLYPHGKMSSYLRRAQAEFENGKDVLVEFRGPFGLYAYAANSMADILMVAAGTGLAPMAQIIDHILENEDDLTRIRLLLCCRRYEDILLKDRLNAWRRRWNFNVRYILSQWSEETDRRLVKYGEDVVCGTRLNMGHVTEEIQRLQRLQPQYSSSNGNGNGNGNGGSAAGGATTISSNSVPPSPHPPSYQVLICGTKSFEKDVMNYLLKAGVVAKRVFRF